MKKITYTLYSMQYITLNLCKKRPSQGFLE